MPRTPHHRNRFSVDVDADTGQIHVEGVLDETTATTVGECMAFATTKTRRVIEIDLSNIYQISGTALEVLEAAVRRASAEGITVRVVTSEESAAERAMALTGTSLSTRPERSTSGSRRRRKRRHLRLLPTATAGPDITAP